MANLIEIILLAVDEASGTIARVAGETEAMGGGSLAMGAAMLTAGLAADALALGIGKIAETGAAFQSFTQEIADNTTMTDGQLGQMRTTILQMSEDGGIAYEKLGTAFMKVMNITNDAAASQGILQVAMESAVSTGGNVVSVANVLANAMHEYGLDVVRAADGTMDLAAIQANAAHVMGVMHLAAAEGNMTLEQFSESSGRSIGIAANLGVSLEDVSAAFTSLTKHGFDASTAGTQVVNILTHMINPTQAAHKELERLSNLTGIDLVSDFSAAGVSSKGLEGVLDDLKAAFSKLGLTEAQGEQEALKLINAQRGGLGLGTLLGTAWGDYNSILKDLNNTQLVNTITEDQYNKMRETAVNQWQRLQQTVRATAITIGVEMLPVASAIMGAVSNLATGVLRWAQAHGTLVGSVLAMFGVLLAFMGILLTFGGALALAGGALGPLITGLGALAGAINGPVIAALVVAGLFLGVFHNQLAALGGVALAAVQAILTAFKTGDFNAAFGTIITAVEHAFGPAAAAAVTRFVSDVLRGLQVLRDAAITFAQAVSGNWFGAQTESVNGFVRAVGVLGTTARDIIITFAQALRGEWQGGATASINAVVRAVGNLGLTLHEFGPAAATALGLVADAFRLLTGGQVEGGLSGFTARLGTWSTGVQGILANLLAQVTGWILRLATGMANWLADALPGMLTGLAHLVVSIVDALRGQAPKVDSAVADNLGGAFGRWVEPAIPPLLKALGRIFDALGTWIDQHKPQIEAKLAGWTDALGAWVTDTAWPKAKAKLDELLGKFLTWIENDAAPMIKARADKWGDALTGWMKDKLPAWTTDWDTFSNDARVKLDEIGAAIATFATTNAPKLGGWLRDMLPAWTTDWDDFSNDARQPLRDVGDAIQRFINDAGGGLVDWIDGWLPDWFGDWDNLSNDVNIALDDARDAIGRFVGNKANDLDDWIMSWSPGFLKSWDALGTAVSGALGKLGAAIEQGFNNTTVKVAAFPGTLVGAMGSLAALLIPKGAELMLGFITGVTNMLGTAMDIVAAMPLIVASAVGSTIGLLFQKGVDLVQGFINGIASKIGAARAAAAELAGLTTDSVGSTIESKSPSRVTMRLGEFFGQGFVLGIQSQYAVAQATASGLGGAVLTGLLDGIDADNADAAKKIADATSAVAKAITDALAAATALSNFDPDSAPSFSVVHAFAVMVGMIVQEFQWVASFFEEKGLKAAGEFGDAAGKVLGLFKYALDLTKGLADFAPPTFASVHAFALAVGLIVQEFQWVASFFKDQALKQAADFADSAGKVLDLVGKAVTAITALGAGPIKDVPFQAVHQLALTVGMIVQELQWVATFFAEKGLAQTALFAETAGKVLDTVTKAVAAVTALPNLVDPGWEAVHRFAVVVGTIVQEIQWVASFFKDQALKSAADFSDSAGKVMGLFNEGIVDGLMKLAEFVAPSKLAIDNFLAVVFYVVQKFAEAASKLSTEGIKATTDFSNAAQAALTATKTGVDAFKDLTKLVVPSKEAIDNLLNAVRYVVDRMLDMANQMTTAGIERVTKFGTASSTVAKGITDVLDLFKKLGETPYKDMLSKGLAAVMADFNVALAAIQALATQSQTFLNSALKFKDNMEAAAAAIAAAAAAAAAAAGTHIPALPSAPSAPSAPGGGTIIGNPKQGHADGGWVVPGQEYQVGERGGETFVSAVPGYIVPHGAGGGGGGGDTLKAEITLNLDGQKVTDVVYTRLLRMRRNKPSLGLS